MWGELGKECYNDAPRMDARADISLLFFFFSKPLFKPRDWKLGQECAYRLFICLL